MYYVGLDVHQNSTSAEILDCNGKRFKRLELKCPWPELGPRLAREVPRPFAVCYEASCGYGYLHEQFSKVADQVKAAHPAKLRVIFQSKHKNNKLDASKLAKVLFLDEVPAVHVPNAGVRLWRQTVEFRQKLLAEQVRAKNRVRAFLKERGIRPSGGLWTRKGTAWLKALELDEASALQRDLLLEQLSELKQKLIRVAGQLKKTSAGQPGVALLRTIPGIGPRTAEALVAYIDDVKRFSSVRKVGAYFGWDPCQDASGSVNRLGHITGDGPPTVRKLLVEAAWTAVRLSPTIGSFYQRVMRKDPDRKKIAIVATAHYINRVAAAMLRTGECWRETAAAPKPSPAESCGGGGEHPSGPQGFSPPPGTTPQAAEAITAPTPLRFPSSLEHEGSD